MRWPLCFARYGQYGQQNWGSIPHSYLTCRSSDFFQRYTLQHLGHGNSPFLMTDSGSGFADVLWHAFSGYWTVSAGWSGCWHESPDTAWSSKTVKSVTKKSRLSEWNNETLTSTILVNRNISVTCTSASIHPIFRNWPSTEYEIWGPSSKYWDCGLLGCDVTVSQT
jgi:hypothetical protein